MFFDMQQTTLADGVTALSAFPFAAVPANPQQPAHVGTLQGTSRGVLPRIGGNDGGIVSTRFRAVGQ